MKLATSTTIRWCLIVSKNVQLADSAALHETRQTDDSNPSDVDSCNSDIKRTQCTDELPSSCSNDATRTRFICDI
ncbi:hypothetical protein KIN20_023891 [Parelaphostrongylus tenuis]|uniref:Uncharacterized protein n=1 Tax=Parelaphostrongylus tenuis TaxID=148309 RepID=A0AAD5QXH9_PARTN|nr:hypothetical protein KIN20_023891 [Parelaphostrongylus tenuis]